MRSETSRVHLGLVAVAGVSWLYLVYMAWGMTNMDVPAAQLFMPAMMHWGAMDLVLVFVMWAIMMAAMMLPSITPLAMRYPGTSKR
jgi:predicted metal-binding membrane protein